MKRVLITLLLRTYAMLRVIDPVNNNRIERWTTVEAEDLEADTEDSEADTEDSAVDMEDSEADTEDLAADTVAQVVSDSAVQASAAQVSAARASVGLEGFSGPGALDRAFWGRDHLLLGEGRCLHHG